MMKGMLTFIIVAIIVFLIVLVAHTLILSWAIGLGWVLGRFLPLSLFEGSLLAVLTTGIVIYVGRSILATSVTSSSDEDWLDEDEEDDLIPPHRFYETDQDKTWEAWVRYRFANAIYEYLLGSPSLIIRMNERQFENTSIRLADAGVALLRSKGYNRKKPLRMTAAMLRRQMKGMEIRPYNDEILHLAVESLQEELNFGEVEEVIQENLWDASCPLFSK